MKSERNKPAIVIGLGNVLRRDDGIGVRLVKSLQESFPWRHIDFIEVGTSPLAALDLVAERPRAVFFDSARMGKPPGTLQHLDVNIVESMAENAFERHEGSLVQLLRILRRLNRAPMAGDVFCVEPQTMDYGTELSACLAQNLRRYIEEISAWLRGIDNPRAEPSRGAECRSG